MYGKKLRLARIIYFLSKGGIKMKKNFFQTIFKLIFLMIFLGSMITGTVVSVDAGTGQSPNLILNPFPLPPPIDWRKIFSTDGPDLVPVALYFDGNNFLNVTIKNEGNLEVPAGIGNLSLFVDGRSMDGYSYSSLADQTFRVPGGSTTIRTGIRMGGSNRRVAVSVDPLYEIYELNEFQNTLSRTMTPPAKNEPDLIISDLFLGKDNSLKIMIINIGNAYSRANLNARLQVTVNGGTAADFMPVLPALPPQNGMATVIAPSPALIISPNSKVRVLLTTNIADEFFDELDNTNNLREETLPNGYALDAYNALLALPQLQRNMIFEGYSGTQNYPAWSASQKADLTGAILALENGDPFRVTAPPALFSGNYISAGDAWQIYLAQIAQSLWIEVHQVVSWHLQDFPDSQLAYLLDSRKLFQYYPGTNQFRFEYLLMGESTAWNPRICYEFLSNLGMIQGTQLDTIYALTDWMRAHLCHMSGGASYTAQYGYAGPPPADKILYPLEGKKHITTACWGTTGLYAAVLRSVNIPVESARITLDDSTHSRAAFPSVDRSLDHSDDPYNNELFPSGGATAISQLFYTYAQMNTLFFNPVLDSNNGITNTPGQQAAFNKGKHIMQIAYDYMSGGLLYEYAQFGPDYLNDSLRGPRIGTGTVVQYAYPYFTDAERASMVAAVENKVKSIGGGDLTLGKNKVVARNNLFSQYK
jgi:hypothetical protein